MKIKGIILALISALAFGIAPLFTKIAYDEGSNAITIIFLRNFMIVPFLLLFALYKKLSFKISKKELKQLILLSLIGSSLTGALLYSSYNYTGIGLATCLHFIYPVIIMIGCLVLFKERPNAYKIVALVVSIIGIAFTVELNSFSILGFSLALLSGLTYAFYVLYLDKTGLKNRNVIIVTLYSAILNSIFVGIYSVTTSQLVFTYSLKGWIYAFLVAILATAIGLGFLQAALQYIDSPTAAIMCTMEPVTSVILGILILNEKATVLKLIGCGFIIVGVILIAIDNKRGYFGKVSN